MNNTLGDVATFETIMQLLNGLPSLVRLVPLLLTVNNIHTGILLQRLL